MLELYNTMSRQKEVFQSRHGRQVKMFTCGPSIYRRPHVGNYRSFLWEDVLQRYLEYSGFTVERVINFTDVEDKAIDEATREGKTVEDVTGPIADQFFKDAKILRIKLPEFIPRSSTSVDQAVELVKILLDKGYAYWDDHDVFFDPLRFEGFGKLFRLDMSRWPKEKKRFRRDTYPGRRWNLGDFILWHGFREGDAVFWDTQIGKGRPSWNIQDPAMITKHLGFALDICCGGIDNIYRHHDYNIAVIESVSGEELAPYWIHGEHLLHEGKKMSKSLGNIIYPEDFLSQGYTGQQVRFYLLYGHHRKRMNLTDTSFQQAAQRLDQLKENVVKLIDHQPEGKTGSESADTLIQSLGQEFQDYMNDDLNIRGAVDALFDTVSHLGQLQDEGRLQRSDAAKAEKVLRSVDKVLQVIFD